MPMSDHEQRQLEGIAFALYGDDPTFLSDESVDRWRYRRKVGADIAFVLGVVLLFTGVAMMVAVWVVGLIVGSVGFLVMWGAWPIVTGRHG